ncbi:hypothetical protein GCM10007418_30550 [Halopseudomonas salina]|uniref:Uncharacterized protein n=1 Tax=Halopseudomonas salina TaxID=1323744 RepID=A0ABQ1Q0G4_9GAMM|nr:hypothetical protein GCM10007418_30550 [Halopseudomonas salina]
MGLCAIADAAVIAWNQNALWGFRSEQTAFWLGMILFAIALFGADALLWIYARFYTHDGSGFNRREGTLTAAHDKASKRPERRWRDTDVKGWRRNEARALREKLAAYPWQQQPCILKARIDPNLSVEAYYRQQEADGIHATPKGDDFDNVHRP